MLRLAFVVMKNDDGFVIMKNIQGGEHVWCENYEQNLFVYFEGYLEQIADKRDIE